MIEAYLVLTLLSDDYLVVEGQFMEPYATMEECQLMANFLDGFYPDTLKLHCEHAT